MSRGRLLPAASPAQPSSDDGVAARTGAAPPTLGLPAALAESLVLVHGGMAQNVGPILNMVTDEVSAARAAKHGSRG